MNLANVFAGFEIPELAKQLIKEGKISRGFAKMMSFNDEFKLTNEQISSFWAMKPAREENESREEYKNRLNFQKQLLKYRAYIFNYSVYDKR